MRPLPLPACGIVPAKRQGRKRRSQVIPFYGRGAAYASGSASAGVTAEKPTAAKIAMASSPWR